MSANKFLYSLAAIAGILSVFLILGLLLHAPMVLVIIAWLVWPVVAVIMVVQLVTSQQPPRRRPEPPVIVQHEDGSFEVRS